MPCFLVPPEDMLTRYYHLASGVGTFTSFDLSVNDDEFGEGGEDDQIAETTTIKDILQETPPELSADIIDHGIIMTGGTSQLRNFPELVFRRTGVKASLADDALYCVAKGTGIALEHLGTYKKSIIAKR